MRKSPPHGQDPFELDREEGDDPGAALGARPGPDGSPREAPGGARVLPTTVLQEETPMVLELGSGTGRLSLQFNPPGDEGRQDVKAVPVDRPGGVYRAETPTLYLDLTDEDAQEMLCDVVGAGRVAHVHMSVPGTSFDRSRPRHRQGKARPPPRELRDLDALFGKPRRMRIIRTV